MLFSLASLLLHFDLCFLSLSPAVLFNSVLLFVSRAVTIARFLTLKEQTELQKLEIL